MIGPPDRRIKRKVIIFFDEINTNTNIAGLMKEVFVDRHIQGERIESNICLVAACNPTKFRKVEQSNLSTGIQVSQKDDTISKLVYRVEPLPESMIP
jgi:hypothetical protein